MKAPKNEQAMYSMGACLTYYAPNPKSKIKVEKGVVNPVFADFFNTRAHINILYGGSSSGKSYAIARMIALWILKGHSILIVRKTAVSLRKSIFSMVKKAIISMGLFDHFHIKESSMEIISLVSRGCAVFVGVDDEHKLLSITPIQAEAFDMLVIEEAVQIPENMFNQLLLRMRGKENWNEFQKRVFLLFNPIFKRHWIFKRFFKNLKPEYRKKVYTKDLRILHTTYKDNPHLSDIEKQVIEDMKHNSPYHYMVYANGEFGVLGKLILPNCKKQDFNFEDVKHLPDFIGGDFGFTNDPTACPFTKYDEKKKIIYVYDEIYETGLTNDLVAVRYKAMCLKWGISPRIESLWDCSEPKSIKELNNYGVNADKASKPNESVLKGLDFLAQHTIIYHSRCVNFGDEAELYIWEEDSDGNPINKPIDKYNHLIDALRYAYWKKIKMTGKIVGSRQRMGG